MCFTHVAFHYVYWGTFFALRCGHFVIPHITSVKVIPLSPSLPSLSPNLILALTGPVTLTDRRVQEFAHVALFTGKGGLSHGHTGHMPRGPRAVAGPKPELCVKSLLVTFNVALSKQSVEKYKNSSENSNSRPISYYWVNKLIKRSIGGTISVCEFETIHEQVTVI